MGTEVCVCVCVWGGGRGGMQGSDSDIQKLVYHCLYNKIWSYSSEDLRKEFDIQCKYKNTERRINI